MIAAVDTYIEERLGRIRHGDGALKIYGFGAARPKGKTEYPCMALTRLGSFSYDMTQARPHFDVFTASEDEFTYEIPDWQGGGELTGPESWSWQPCPTPVILTYQVDLLAATKAHADGLPAMLFEALPVPFRPEIDGRHVLMVPDGDPMNLDELEKPVFRTAVRFEVRNVWIDRATAWTTPGIQDIGQVVEAEEPASHPDG